MTEYKSESAVVKNCKIGKEVRLYEKCSLSDSQLDDNVSIGDFSLIRNSVLDNKVEIGRRNTIDHANIGKATYTGEFCVAKYCSIGKYCAISWNVSIGGANHEINLLAVTPLNRIMDQPAKEYPSFIEETVRIGNDVWIAAGAHILRNVKIGDGAVIAANAVVTKDVPPYSVVGGVPAKVLYYRFSNEVIEQLLKIKWWDWSDEKIAKAKPLFQREVSMDLVRELKELG